MSSNVKELDLTLRDVLAESRTLLANERTFLAYLRTALSLIVAGLSFLKFFELSEYLWIGRGFIVIGVIIFAKGLRRFLKTKQAIDKYKYTM